MRTATPDALPGQENGPPAVASGRINNTPVDPMPSNIVFGRAESEGCSRLVIHPVTWAGALLSAALTRVGLVKVRANEYVLPRAGV